jgi:molybdate/tungstate transport system ATP-binding protein
LFQITLKRRQVVLELQSINKKLGDFTLSNLDLNINTNEYFVLLGPSGVGKTVLLEIITGIMKTDSGKIMWNGKDITSVPAEIRNMSIVYQDYALFPHINVSDNIGYGLKSRGVSENKIISKTCKIAELLQIKHLLNRSPETLSGGEQQRVAIARAIVTSPELILLDEPLSALDPKNRRKLQKELKQLHKETGVTFIHVTHNIEEALMLGERIGVMLEGKILQVGTPEELFYKPTDILVADFLGVRNLWRISKYTDEICTINNTEIHIGKRDESINYVWIRPEEIIISREPFRSSARNQFNCKVIDWEPCGSLISVRLATGSLNLAALITYSSFNELQIEKGTQLFTTFKSSALHCF